MFSAQRFGFDAKATRKIFDLNFSLGFCKFQICKIFFSLKFNKIVKLS